MNVNIHASIIDGAWYTKQELARTLGEEEKWVERNIMYPEDPSTKKPLCRCQSCGAEFAFPDPVICPECGAKQIELVRGCPRRKVGGAIMFSGFQLRKWGEQYASAPVRKSWDRYLKLLEEARRHAIAESS